MSRSFQGSGLSGGPGGGGGGGALDELDRALGFGSSTTESIQKVSCEI